MGSIRGAYTAVEDAFQAVIQTLQDAQESMQDKLADFKKQRCTLEDKIANCNESLTGNKKISLNVGGTVFETTEETLLKETETFFWAMLRSGQWEPDKETGQYFIDRSPTMFGVILDYLRNGKACTLDAFSANEIEQFRTELDFYQVPFSTMQQPICWDSATLWPTNTVGSMNLCADNTTVIISSVSDRDRGIHTRHLVPHCGRVDFSLKITSQFRNCRASFFFNPTGWGVGLITGNLTKDNGGKWDSWFPKIAETSNAVLVKRYKFSLKIQAESSELTVTWPTGDIKTVTLPKPPAFINLAIGKKASLAVFKLKNQ
eukprot:TRINITY_DN67320_c3_g3_i2.p1 TRINITY_DN67320_c3_g3~~TRINITY_DN67320_c3_g3_i2.p1  ORF type:complete len:317 (+),score=15.54 TRINITY_DN67320_c3_g3_i2:402-1352(+)